MLAGLKRYYGNDDLHFITFSCYRAGGSNFVPGGLPFAPLSHANGGSLFSGLLLPVRFLSVLLPAANSIFEFGGFQWYSSAFG